MNWYPLDMIAGFDSESDGGVSTKNSCFKLTIPERWRKKEALKTRKSVCSNPDCCKDYTNDDVRRCSSCFKAQYCCRECQVKHWRKHKTECRKHRNNESKSKEG